jgi:putative transposase
VLKVLTGYAISQRLACVLIGVDPKTFRRERPPDHGAIRTAMREVAGRAAALAIEGSASCWKAREIQELKKLYRLYREERLSVRSS